MSKLTSLIRRAPKRFSAIVAIVAAAIIIPAAVNAWGPIRDTYTIEKPASKVALNSITNNPNIGDERNFVGIREVGSANTWYDSMEVQDGKEYLVRMYVHNNAASNLGLVAENVTAKFNLPTNTAKSIQVNGFLSTSNMGADKNGNKGSYGEVYDHATFTSARDFNLSYVKGSLKYENNVFGAAGAALPESIFTSTGAKLGYDKLDGKIPGCFQYAGYVTFKVKPQVAKTTNFTLTKMVSKHGENKWSENYKAQPGEIVDFILAYKNTGNVQHNDVTFRDTLPKGLTYVNGSTTWSNASKQNVKASDNIANGTGINVGSYAPGANAYTVFSAKVASKDQLACGVNTLRNVGKVNTGGYAVEDDATVTVDKECEPPVVYSCTSLTVTQVDRTKFKFQTSTLSANATFKSVTYIIRDANGKEVERKTSTGLTLDYTRTTPGKYSVQAVVTFTVKGQDKTATSNDCKKEFEVKKEIVPEYTCKALSVQRLSRTDFRFTTDYTVKNATFKNIVYVIRDASGKEIDRKTVTGKTLDYKQTKPGKYTVQATVVVTVNGQTKTVTSNDCKKEFEVKKEIVPVYTCDTLKVQRLSKEEFRFTTEYTVKDATFKSVTYVIRDASGKEITRKVVTDGKALDYKQTKPGKYTVQATVTVTVNGQTKTVTSNDCKKEFEVPKTPEIVDITVCDLKTKKVITIKENQFDSSKHSKNLDDCKEAPKEFCPIPGKETLPKDSPDCKETPVTPPELPQTGAGDGIVAVIGLGALIASIGYYVASRRALGL